MGTLNWQILTGLTYPDLNRLRAGISEIGLPKTVLLARQIYEFNPYPRISLFHQGLTLHNLDEFLLGSPRLQVVVDECDDLAMKILLRERARSLHLPVLMETSDRGMMDIERFDLEPERPLLHGFIGDIKAADISPELSNDEKIRYILPLVGVETLSTPAAASMVEIKKTISTWPQLGSEVALGGAIVTAAVRRLALGKPLPSNRHYVDVEALLSQSQAEHFQNDTRLPRIHEFDPDGLQATDNASFPEFIQFVVEHGILAPSAGNSQPWKFHYESNELWVIHDKQRSKNLLDAEYRAAYIALGAVVKNVVIAAAHRGYDTQIKPFPPSGHQLQADQYELVASLSFSADEQIATSETARLFPLLSQRVTNRKLSQRVLLPTEQRQALERIAAGYGCQVQFLTDEGGLAELGEIVGEGDWLRILCSALHAELMAEIRWTPEETRTTRDGLDIASLELTESQAAVLKLLERTDVTSFLRNFRAGSALADSGRKAVKAASAVGLISVQGQSPADILRGGQAIEHIWLKASEFGLAWHPITALMYISETLNSPGASIFQPWELDRLSALDVQFKRLFPPAPHERA